MAQSNNKVICLVVLLSLLLIISMADSRQLLGAPKAAVANCKAVTDAEKGDTCSSIAEIFNLEAGEFSAINPNLDCDNIFIGQWLCIDGFVSP